MEADRTMVFGGMDDVILCVHGAEAPSAQEWQEYIKFSRQLPQSYKSCLVASAGGGPSAKQRNDLQKQYLVEHPMMRVAVVTESVLAKNIVGVLSWFNPNTKAFAYAKGQGIQEALAYLEVSGVSAQRIGLELQKMRIKLGWK